MARTLTPRREPPSVSRSASETRFTTTRLYPTRNDLPEAARREVIGLLNQRLADSIDLQTQCKQAHWNVKGPSFIALHKLFDEIHSAADEYVDLLAERIVQLGGVAEGVTAIVAERSELAQYPINISSGEEHVWALSNALASFGERVRRAIDETDELGDTDATDICTEISRGVDKWLWFVEAHADGATAATATPGTRQISRAR